MQRFTLRLLAVITLLAVFSIVITQPVVAWDQQLGIRGHDDREIVEGMGYPWRTIGRVNNAGSGFCTGVLIGARQVLTAAHCVRSKQGPGGMAAAADIHFLAGYSRGDYVAHSQAIAISRSWSRGVQELTEDDWAVITLNKPLGSSIGFLRLEQFGDKDWRNDQKSAQRYAQAGYSHDRAHVLTRHRNCDILGFLRGGQAFAHGCDATNGDSGSPILALRGNTYSIVGLHVASSRLKSFGVAIAAGRILSQLPSLSQLPASLRQQ